MRVFQLGINLVIAVTLCAQGYAVLTSTRGPPYPFTLESQSVDLAFYAKPKLAVDCWGLIWSFWFEMDLHSAVTLHAQLLTGLNFF